MVRPPVGELIDASRITEGHCARGCEEVDMDTRETERLVPAPIRQGDLECGRALRGLRPRALECASRRHTGTGRSVQRPLSAALLVVGWGSG